MGALLVGRLGKSKQATIKKNWLGAVLVGREFVGGYLGELVPDCRVHFAESHIADFC